MRPRTRLGLVGIVLAGITLPFITLNRKTNDSIMFGPHLTKSDMDNIHHELVEGEYTHFEMEGPVSLEMQDAWREVYGNIRSDVREASETDIYQTYSEQIASMGVVNPENFTNLLIRCAQRDIEFGFFETYSQAELIRIQSLKNSTKVQFDKYQIDMPQDEKRKAIRSILTIQARIINYRDSQIPDLINKRQEELGSRPKVLYFCGTAHLRLGDEYNRQNSGYSIKLVQSASHKSPHFRALMKVLSGEKLSDEDLDEVAREYENLKQKDGLG